MAEEVGDEGGVTLYICVAGSGIVNLVRRTNDLGM
jgi:hypothetical protein